MDLLAIIDPVPAATVALAVAMLWFLPTQLRGGMAGAFALDLIGWIANRIAIQANHGFMPVVGAHPDKLPLHVVATATSQVPLLVDRIPTIWGMSSVGDLLIWATPVAVALTVAAWVVSLVRRAQPA